MLPLSPGRPAHLLLSWKSSTVFNALTRRMAALITFILRQAALVALAFLLLFLLEVTTATVDKAKAWWKGGSPSGTDNVIETISVLLCGCVHYTLINFSIEMYVGNSDISSQYKKIRTFKSVCVQCPLNLQMIVMTK